MNSVMDKIIFDAEVSERKILIVPLHTIRHTPYNPASRTKEGPTLKKTIDSIRKNGLLSPILITSDRDLIDGNRRLASCRILGHKTIECIVCDIDRDEAFIETNSNQIPLGGRGWLEIGLGNNRRMPANLRAQFDELHSLIGAYGIKLLIDQRLGMNILSLCKQVTILDGKYDLAQVIMLVAAHKLTNKINFITRAPSASREEKVAAIDALLAETGV